MERCEGGEIGAVVAVQFVENRGCESIVLLAVECGVAGFAVWRLLGVLVAAGGIPSFFILDN